MIRLIFNSGPQAGQEINSAAASIRMGRHPDENDFVLTDPLTSSRHCRLDRTPQGGYLLEDLASTNGTFVNGQRIKKVSLSTGDRFSIGGTEIEVAEGRPRLQIVRGPRSGVELPMGDQAITVGRAGDNVLELDDPKVSSYHAAILCLPTGFVLQDNGSTNGSFVNDVRVERHTLVDGDVLTIGDNDLRFLIDQPEQLAANLAVEAATSSGEEARGRLVFVAGPHVDMVVPLGDQAVTFGRRDDATFVLSDVQISGSHCVVMSAGVGFQVTDLRSTNGTYVNGARISQPTPLRPGDLLAMGTSVAEFHVAGGVKLEQGMTMATVIAEGAELVPSQPKFVINGSVFAKPMITVGRSPQCDIFLEEDDVSRLHCEVSWDGEGFVLEDKSKAGTYLGDKRIVKERLQTGHVLRIGQRLINVTVRGDRCTLEEIDAAAALAAIQVARETQFNMAQAVLDPANSGAMVGAGYKTVMKMDVADVEAMVQERKAKLKRKGAPMWRPTSDIQPQPIKRLAVGSGVAITVAVCAWMYASADAAFLNHPLSAGHSSRAFAEQASALSLPGGCQSCHSPGRGVDEAKCGTCHGTFVTSVQPRHRTPDAKIQPGQRAPKTCGGCHAEHRSSARLSALEAPSTCKDGACHPTAHQQEFFQAKTLAPVLLKAPALSSLDLSQEELHLKHAQLPSRCIGCHGTKDGQKANAKLSCFRCHAGGQTLAVSQCRSCHVEHQGQHLARLDDPAQLAPLLPPLSSGRSLLSGGALALVVFFPLGVISVVYRLRSRRRAEKLVAASAAIPTESVKRLVHSINMEKCVGCHMCVSACPASVLELVNHKSTVVNFDACIQCRKCEAACNFDALRMHDADKQPPMVEVPDLDTHYQTPVQGMYLIGQVSGTPLVKNASNLGRLVTEHMMANGVRKGAARAAGVDAEVIIVGSGPAGLATALACTKEGLSYVVLEKSREFSATIRNYYHKGKELLAEPQQIETVGYLKVWDCTREEILAAWQEQIDQNRLQISFEEGCADVKKEGEIFTVKTVDLKGNQKRVLRGLRVVLGIGSMGTPRKLGCPGDDMAKVLNSLVDQDAYDRKNVLVVGGGDSAVEVAMALSVANNNSNKVWLSYRKDKFDRIKPRNRQRFEEAVKAGRITALFSTTVKEVTEKAAVIKYGDGRTEEIPNDFCFAQLGGEPPIKWLQSIGIAYTQKPHSWSAGRTDELVKRLGKG